MPRAVVESRTKDSGAPAIQPEASPPTADTRRAIAVRPARDFFPLSMNSGSVRRSWLSL
jgi:hypothetical protein